jgi:hypothetical protein
MTNNASLCSKFDLEFFYFARFLLGRVDPFDPAKPSPVMASTALESQSVGGFHRAGRFAGTLTVLNRGFLC